MFTLEPKIGKKQKALVFPPLIHWIYRWVESEVLGTPLVITSKFLVYFRKENLLS